MMMFSLSNPAYLDAGGGTLCGYEYKSHAAVDSFAVCCLLSAVCCLRRRRSKAMVLSTIHYGPLEASRGSNLRLICLSVIKEKTAGRQSAEH